jgi:hypothetical protein
MKTTAIILTLAGVGLAYLYFTSKNGRPRKDNPYEKPVSGKIIFSDTTQTQVEPLDSLPQPPDINIILPK